MAFLRKAGNILNSTVSNYVSQEISSSTPFIFKAIRCMSSSKLFVGGLSYSSDNESLREAFSKYGDVAEARVVLDRDSGSSRGFGFVTFASIEDASAAMQAWDQQDTCRLCKRQCPWLWVEDSEAAVLMKAYSEKMIDWPESIGTMIEEVDESSDEALEI